MIDRNTEAQMTQNTCYSQYGLIIDEIKYEELIKTFEK